MLQRKIMIDVTLTPEELALEFSNMDGRQQAIFFSELAMITDNWEKPFCFQLQQLIDNPALTKEGRRIMEEIGEYGVKP